VGTFTAGHGRPFGSVASLAATIDRWLSFMCRRRSLYPITNGISTESGCSNVSYGHSTPAFWHANQRLRPSTIRPSLCRQIGSCNPFALMSSASASISASLISGQAFAMG
jgi:hypothetical protein